MDELEELQKLYPKLSRKNLLIAKEILDQYLLLAWEMWEGSEAEKSADWTYKNGGPLIIYKAEQPG